MSIDSAARHTWLLTPHMLPTLWYSRWARLRAYVVDLQPASSLPHRASATAFQQWRALATMSQLNSDYISILDSKNDVDQ